MMMRVLVVLAVVSLCGCASSTMQVGTPIDPGKVSQIEKGVTTRAQVEAMFGQASGTSLLGSGRRIATYSSINSTGEAHVTAANFIPIAGAFVPVHGTGTSRVQQLQIIYTAQDVVEDYSYSDNASQTTTTAGAFTGFDLQTRSSPTSTTPAPAASQ